MKVIFDANVIIADRWLTGADFRAFASTRGDTGHSLVVPMLALDEAVNDYAEKLADAEGQLAKAAESLTRLLHRPYELDALHRDKLVSQYRGTLIDRLRDAGARLAQYPRVPHHKVVRRALDRRRPFDDEGHNGYRDVLMWHTVLEELRGSEEVAFISNDRGFYFVPRESRRSRSGASDEKAASSTPGETAPKPSAMHPHLESDLIGRARSPQLYLSLRDFVEKEVNPRLVPATSVKEALNSDATYKDFDVQQAVREHLLDGFAYFVLDAAMLGMPPEVEHASVVSIEEVLRVEVADARRTSRELLLDLVAECEVRVETYGWQEVPEPEDVDLDPANDDEFLDEVAPRVLLRIEATFGVNPDNWQVTAVEINNVDPIR